MKLYLIANVVYYPIEDTNKYIRGTIDGILFLNSIKTLEEIKKSSEESGFEFKECSNLHEVCKFWGNRL